MAAGKQVAIIGAALDLGAGRRGVDMGPSAIRYAGLNDRLHGLGYQVLDWGDVETAVLEATEETDSTARYLPEIKAACGRVARLVGLALDQGALPLVLGGDHSVALGTLGGLAQSQGVGGVLWIDAHSDMNTPETSPSGNVHGMPLAAALGFADGASRAMPGRCPRSSRRVWRSSGSARSTRRSGSGSASSGSRRTR